MTRPGSFLSRPPRNEPPLRKSEQQGSSADTSNACHTLPSSGHRPGSHSGRSTGHRSHVDTNDAEILAAARRFTEHALRLTLEVLDRKRPAQQLRAFLEPTLIDTVRVLTGAPLPGRSLGTATLERIHLSMVDPTTAEVFGTYSRGQRVFAIAARVTNRPRNQGWRVTTLRIA